MASILKTKSFVLAVIAFATSCGKTEQKVELKNEVIAEGDDPNCKRKKCSAVNFSVTDGAGVPVETTSLFGNVGEPVAWTLKVKIDEGPVKRIKIAVKQAPTWLEKDSSKSEEGIIVLKGSPIEVATQAQLVVVARDVSRCTALEEKTEDRKDCTSPARDFTAEGYDKVISLQYSIGVGNGIPGAIPQGGGQTNFQGQNNFQNQNNFANQNSFPNQNTFPNQQVGTFNNQQTQFPNGAQNPNCNTGIFRAISGVIPFGGLLGGSNSGACN